MTKAFFVDPPPDVNSSIHLSSPTTGFDSLTSKTSSAASVSA